VNLISAKQAARLVNVSRETIFYWIRTGRLRKHPYPLSEKSKQMYKRDSSVRYFLLSEEEVIAAAKEKYSSRLDKLVA
jgi:hypothetical protein